jgi:hypothetical protein
MLRAALALLLLGAPAWAADADLFSCRVIVTGTDHRDDDALPRCLQDAIIKATGRPSLREDARLAPVLRDAPFLVEDVLYLDRMTDIPHHDEQGSRDRPYDLIAWFQPDKLTARLGALGIPVWHDRPERLELLITVEPARGNPFTVTAEQDVSERHRQALLAAADRFGLHIALPTEIRLLSRLPWLSASSQGLRGVLKWSDADFGWNATWTLVDRGRTPQPEWTVRGVAFDEAYRVGLGGAAERLSH